MPRQRWQQRRRQTVDLRCYRIGPFTIYSPASGKSPHGPDRSAKSRRRLRHSGLLLARRPATRLPALWRPAW